MEKAATEEFKNQHSRKEIQQRDLKRWWVTVSAAGITASRPLVSQPAYLPGFLGCLRWVCAAAEAHEGHLEHGFPLPPLFFWKWALMMWCLLLLFLLLRWRANTPSSGNFLEQALPPAAPDYSSLVVAAERQPTPRRPPDSHIVPCDSGELQRREETAAAVQFVADRRLHKRKSLLKIDAGQGCTTKFTCHCSSQACCGYVGATLRCQRGWRFKGGARRRHFLLPFPLSAVTWTWH